MKRTAENDIGNSGAKIETGSLSQDLEIVSTGLLGVEYSIHIDFSEYQRLAHAMGVQIPPRLKLDSGPADNFSNLGDCSIPFHSIRLFVTTATALAEANMVLEIRNQEGDERDFYEQDVSKNLEAILAAKLVHEIAHTSPEAKRLELFTVRWLLLIDGFTTLLALVAATHRSSEMVTTLMYIATFLLITQLATLGIQPLAQYVYNNDITEKYCRARERDEELLALARKAVKVTRIETSKRIPLI